MIPTPDATICGNSAVWRPRENTAAIRSTAAPKRGYITFVSEQHAGFGALGRLRSTTGRGEPQGTLVRGDNLPALERLAASSPGLFRLVYLDPPYNSGRAFEEYDDRRSAFSWAEMMRPRLAALLPLLRDDGSVFIEIDDNELGTLLTLGDEVFGRDNRITVITVVRSAATGHKAQNASPVNVADFLVGYAKKRSAFTYYPQVRVRASYDDAYNVWLDNPRAEPSAWTFCALPEAFARAKDAATAAQLRKQMGRAAFQADLAQFALAHCEHVVRYAQPRLEAIGIRARELAIRSKAEPGHVFVLEREGRPPFIVRGGNRILFLRDKVRGEGKQRVLVEPLTNVWSDVPFQGIAREGGVTFRRNKKPEALLERVIAMTTSPGDWVLDPFVGSGTTAAAAHKMGRPWVGIDEGEHLLSLAVPRLTRVIAGEDATGISKRHDFRGGGGFRVYEA